MITKETCVKIFNCHNEIEKAENLIKEMRDKLSQDKEKTIPTFENAFGEKRGLQLGVPSGHSSHWLYNVSFELSIKIIEDHIVANKKRLEELMAIAKIELYE
jgi:hypothetical protein